MWVALLDNIVIMGFDRRPRLRETAWSVGFYDGVARTGCHVPKKGDWKELRVQRMKDHNSHSLVSQQKGDEVKQ